MRQFNVWCLASALAMPATLLAEPLPDFVGLHLSEIKAMPEFADVTLEVAVVDSFQRRGEVLLQIPSAGSEIGIDRMVYLKVSDGLVVPDLQGQTQAEAEANLSATGIGSEATRNSHFGVPSGIVADQIPGAGTRIDASRKIVFLLVADGTIEVPDLQGLTHSAALESLAKLGLAGRIEPPDFRRQIGSTCQGSTYYGSRVTSSEPTPGSIVTLGTQIIVRYETFVSFREPPEPCFEGTPL